MNLHSTSRDEVTDLLVQPLIVKLVTVNEDGTTRLTPLWFKYHDGNVIFNTHEDTSHVENLKRKKTASVLVDAVKQPYRVHMIGEAQVEQRACTKEEIAGMYVRYLGSYEKAEAYGAQLLSIGQRVFITFTPRKIVTYNFSRSRARTPIIPLRTVVNSLRQPIRRLRQP